MDQSPPRGTTNALDRRRRDAARCVACGLCRAVCPSFLIDSRESNSPRGRIALIRAVLEKRLVPSRIYRERLETCTSCLACEAACPSKVPIASVIRTAREDVFLKSDRDVVSSVAGLALRSGGIMRSLAWLAPVALHYGLPGRLPAGAGKEASRRGPAGSKPGSRGRAAFYPGCAIRFFQHDIADASAVLLEAAGYEVLMLDDAPCCGRPLFFLGDRAGAAELAARNRDMFASVNADIVVTACASCGLTLKQENPELLGRSAFRSPPILDIHEVLAECAQGLNLSPVYETITWHEPCHLTRGQGLGRELGRTLGLLPGAELRGMDYPGRCCGFGGVMRINHHKVSDAIGEMKARDIIRSGADVVATGCPGCRMHILNSLRRMGSTTEVVHTVQLIEKRMRPL